MSKIKSVDHEGKFPEWNITGRVYGLARVIGWAGKDNQGRDRWVTQCTRCSKLELKVGYGVIKGVAPSCHCRSGSKRQQAVTVIDCDVAKLTLPSGHNIIIDTRHSVAVDMHAWHINNSSVRTIFSHSLVCVPLARFVWFLEYGESPPNRKRVLRIDRNGMDYRVSNLRVSSPRYSRKKRVRDGQG